jgi:hypothetical protein
MSINMYYSASKNTFYPSSFKTSYVSNNSWPADAVKVSDAIWKEFGQGLPPKGKVRGGGEDGLPCWVDTPVIELTQQSQVERAWRNLELVRCDIELNKIQDGMGYGTIKSWRDYRCSLRDWPENKNFPNSRFRPVAPDTHKE